MRRLRIHKEGKTILLCLLALLCVLNITLWWQSVPKPFVITATVVSIVAFCYFLYFFRSPRRIVSVSDPSLLIAPADGKIVVIEETDENEFLHERRIQVSIFMSLISVHANWYPVKGIVNYVKHHKGRHTAAYLPKSSNENEHSSIGMTSEGGTKILIKQIAGALAQRIVTYAKEDKAVHINEQLGFIKFGSRVDIFLPLDTEIYVKVGDKTTGNETIIARLNE